MTEMPKWLLVIALASGIGAFPMALYSIDAAIVLVLIGAASWGFGLISRDKKW